MKYVIRIVSIIGLLSMTQLAYSAQVTESFATGETLTQKKMDNIKDAVNSKQDRIVGTCPPGESIGAVNADGSVICQTDADELNALDQRIMALEAEPKANIAATVPTPNDDMNAGFTEGSVWVDVTNGDAYILVDTAPGAAVWKQITNNSTLALQPDFWEEDDSAAGASQINLGISQGHNFYDDAEDWMKFPAVGGMTYRIETFDLSVGDGTNGTDTILELIDVDGSTLIESNDDIAPPARGSRITWTAGTSGTYYIRVKSRLSITGGNLDYKVVVM